MRILLEFQHEKCVFKKELPGGEPLPWALTWCAFPSSWMLLSLLFRLVSNPAPASAGQLWLLALLHRPWVWVSPGPACCQAHWDNSARKTKRLDCRGHSQDARGRGVRPTMPISLPTVSQNSNTRRKSTGCGVSVWGSPTAWTKAQEMEILMKPQSEIDDSISEIK